MKNRIIIKGKEDELILSVTLKDILLRIENPISYNWKVLWFEGIGQLDRPIKEVEDIINHSVNGQSYSFQELIKLSDNLDQLLEIVIIGDRDINKLIRYNDDNEMYHKCEYVIELIDSSFWEITSSELKSIQIMKNNFEGVSDIK